MIVPLGSDIVSRRESYALETSPPVETRCNAIEMCENDSINAREQESYLMKNY